MLKNKWFWCILAALILIIIFIFVFISCSDNVGTPSRDSVETSVGGEASCFTEPSVPDLSCTESNVISDESITEYSGVMQESSTENSVNFPEQSTFTSEDDSSTEDASVVSADEVSENSQPQPLLVTLPVIALPDEYTSPWDGKSADGFERGMGTENDPYIIATPSQLAFFKDSVNSGVSYAGKYIKLASNLCITDITAEAPMEWESIGNTKNPFCGTFDGDNHVISGLYGGSLFGYIRGSIKNLGITDSYITSYGGLVDTASRDFKSDTVPFIESCFITRSAVVGSGGIAGYAGGYDIINCINDATVTGTDDWVGGIIGQVALGSMKNCYNFGTVQTESFCGGVVGNAFNSTYKNCYNVGKILCGSDCGSFAAVSYDSAFTDCGVLEGTAKYVLYLSDMSPQTEAEGIEILTKDSFQ